MKEESALDFVRRTCEVSYDIPLMQTLSFADHFSSPGMLVGTIVFLVIELLSVGIFLLIVIHYRRVVSKHRLLPASIQHTLEKEPEKGTTALLWAYIILTVAVTVFTTLLFLWQPHLY